MTPLAMFNLIFQLFFLLCVSVLSPQAMVCQVALDNRLLLHKTFLHPSSPPQVSIGILFLLCTLMWLNHLCNSLVSALTILFLQSWQCFDILAMAHMPMKSSSISSTSYSSAHGIQAVLHNMAFLSNLIQAIVNVFLVSFFLLCNSR